MSRENDLQTINQTAIKLKGKLLCLLDDYDHYSENYSIEAMTLHNELFNFNDAVEMLDYNNFSSFDILDDDSLKTVAELSRQIAKAYSIPLIYNEKNIDTIELPKGWIVVRNDSNQIIKIIYNEGNDVVFVNKYGEVQNIVKSPTTSKTKFLNKTLNIENSNQMLINANYTYSSKLDRFLPENDAKRAFDITGNIELNTNFEKRNNATPKQTKTTMTTAKKETKKVEKQKKKKEVTIREKKEKISNNKGKETSKYYKCPEHFYESFSPDIMKTFEKQGNTTNCNLFLNKLTNLLDETIAKKILPNGIKSAAEMHKDWQSNSNLECLNPKGHFDNNRTSIQKIKDAETAGEKANELANQNYLVLAASPDFKGYTAHVAIVIAQRNIYNFDYNPELSYQSCYQGTSGLDKHQQASVKALWDYPVFLQAGNSTGIVPPGSAFSRILFENDKVDYYVVKN